MKIKLLHIIFFVLSLSLLEANQSFTIEENELQKMMKSNKLYIIGLNGKSTWNKNTAKVKNFQSMSQGILEFKVSKIDFDKYKKNTVFVVSSKKNINSLHFVKKLRALGFYRVRYLKDGNSTWEKILLNFRGIKLFSVFNN